MKLKEGFKIRKMCGENIISATGLKNMNFNKMITLNSSAAFLWEKFYGTEFEVSDLAAALVGEYGIDMETALADSKNLVDSWRAAEVLE